MELLIKIKYNNHRSRPLSIFLISFFQINLLALLMTEIFKPFYQESFGLLIAYNNINTPWIYYMFLSMNLLIGFFTCLAVFSNLVELKFIFLIISQFIKLFVYVGFIPLFVYNLIPLLNDYSIEIKAIGIINLVFYIIYACAHEFLNWSYRFRQADFCNKRFNSQISLALVILSIVVIKIFNPLYACAIYIIRSITSLTILLSNYEY